MSSKDALELVIEEMKQNSDYYSVIEPIKIIDVHLSYSLNTSEDGLYRLAWEFCLEDLPSIYVDVNN